MKIGAWSIGFVLVSLISGTAWAGAEVSGTVTYLQRIVLPKGVVVRVVLQDVTRADAPAEVIAETKFKAKGQVPLPFKLTFSEKKLRPHHRYAVRASIKDKDDFLFVTNRQFPVLTQGSKDTVTVLLVPAAPQEGEAPTLEKTDWRLVEVQDKRVEAADGLREPHLRLVDGRVAGSGTCNMIRGVYKLREEKIRFSHFISTKMACSDLETESSFLSALAEVQRWKMQSDELVFFNKRGDDVARFLPMSH